MTKERIYFSTQEWHGGDRLKTLHKKGYAMRVDISGTEIKTSDNYEPNYRYYVLIQDDKDGEGVEITGSLSEEEAEMYLTIVLGV